MSEHAPVAALTSILAHILLNGKAKIRSFHKAQPMLSLGHGRCDHPSNLRRQGRVGIRFVFLTMVRLGHPSRKGGLYDDLVFTYRSEPLASACSVDSWKTNSCLGTLRPSGASDLVPITLAAVLPCLWDAYARPGGTIHFKDAKCFRGECKRLGSFIHQLSQEALMQQDEDLLNALRTDLAEL